MEPQPAIDGSDRELAEAVLFQGDERAFRTLFRRHTPRLLAFVTRLLGRPGPEAEDVVQDTWLRVCRGLERFRWDAAFSTWLLGIALNVVRDHLRRQTRTATVEIDPLPEAAAPRVPHEERIDLERAIQRLPDGYRLVLVLHDVEGMKHSEIARRLEISDGTSKSQLFQARRQLRSMLSRGKGDGHE